MAFLSVNKFILNRSFRQSLVIFRYVRNVSRRGRGPKLLEGSVKTLTKFEDNVYAQVENYEEFVKKAKTEMKFNELEIEKAFTREEDFKLADGKSDPAYGSISKDDESKRFIKKKIIERKYVQKEKETNLLTYAAKEQIRYLHRTNPDEWTPEVLSHHFPITVSGIKKLLKNNFVLISPEKIKAHDEQVAKRWAALESGKPSELVSFYTQRLWDEGKIVKQNYQGNPDFPSVSTSEENKIVLKEEKKHLQGEYSAIIQPYINYEKNKELSQKSCSDNKLQIIENSVSHVKNSGRKNKFDLFKEKNKYFVDDDALHNKNSSNILKNSKSDDDEADILLNQFKENLMEEKQPEEFKKWMHEKSKVSEIPQDVKECFVKIPKYKREFMEVGRTENADEDVHSLGEQFKYSQFKGKKIKSKIKIPANSYKQKGLYKVGHSVYNEYGKFLYKVPT